MKLWPWSRLADLEARIEALETGTRWTEVPARAAPVDMDPASGIWLDLAHDAPGLAVWDEDEERVPGVYL